jgi:hypothetical protein
LPGVDGSPMCGDLAGGGIGGVSTPGCGGGLSGGTSS